MTNEQILKKAIDREMDYSKIERGIFLMDSRISQDIIWIEYSMKANWIKRIVKYIKKFL